MAEVLKKIRVGLLGFGVVAGGVFDVINMNRESIAHKEGLDIEVKKILIRDNEREIALKKNPNVGDLLCTDIKDIVNDTEIDIVCEAMGGTTPARDYIIQVLRSGKSIATANKEVVAKHWPELEGAAKEGKAGLYIEATCGGGIPIIRTVLDSLAANDITKIMGILNGTTNYILTKMSNENADFSEVLKDAQALGYAEANPSADVDGWDSVYKLSILSSIAFHARVDYNDIYREGITNVSSADIAIAKDLGYEIKLLAIGKKVGGANGKIELRVHPTMIPASHPLASVNDVFNAVFIDGNAVDEVMLYGRGAGAMPTASAIVGDVIYAAHLTKPKQMTFKNEYDAPQTLALQNDWVSEYCIRVSVDDEVGVLEKIAHVLAENSISVRSMIQRGYDDKDNVEIVVITHESKELSLQKSLEEFSKLDCVRNIVSVLRVEH